MVVVIMGILTTLMPTVIAPIEYQSRVTGYPNPTYAAPVTLEAVPTVTSEDEIQPSGGYYKRFRRSFKIDASLTADPSLAITDPTQGDILADSDGFTWTVVKVHRGFISSTVGCVRFTVGPDQVDWRQTNQQTNAFGDRITDPNTFPLGGVLACRVQPADNTILDQFGKRGAMQHYAVYVLSDAKFTYGDLLIQTNANNRKFIIRDWRSREDIQNAMTILAEVLP